MQVNAGHSSENAQFTMWQLASTALFDRELQFVVIDKHGEVHALAFSCVRVVGGWINAETKAVVDLRPNHWRAWALKT
jgi:hypothetical protein